MNLTSQSEANINCGALMIEKNLYRDHEKCLLESYNQSMSEKWEYQVIQNMAITGGNKKLVPELNTLGQDGWEAVSVGAKASGAIEYVLMKRRIL